MDKKIQEKLGNIQEQFEGGVAFLHLYFHRVLTKTKKKNREKS